MSVRNLSALFRPRSVAVIGATARPDSVGAIVMHNLLQGGFVGPIMPVNPKHSAIGGVLAYASVQALPMVPDLGVIVTPPASVPEVLEDLGRHGVHAAIVMTTGLSASDAGWRDDAMAAARRYGMRVLGPSSIGLLVPGIGLNASYAPQPAAPGQIAFVSQSAAMCTTVLDWAKPKGIGFSHFISLGEASDVDFGDVLDYLGSDPSTRSILLYIESVRHYRNFMSAARAAARNKPVLAIKAGRMDEGAKAAASHTGVLAGADIVFDAAIRRAGMLRVYDIDELFAAVETLARSRPVKGRRLAVLTNGGGIGVMAVDDLIEGGGSLAQLTADTLARLDAVMPPGWSRGNPVDMGGTASAELYAKALATLFAAPEIDAVLCMHAPTAITSSDEIAAAVIALAKANRRAHLTTCWVGDEAAASARRLFNAAAIPTYDTPRQAVRAFQHLIDYRRNQEMLMETPPSAPVEFTPAAATARLVVEQALAAGKSKLSEAEAMAIFAAYGIPTVETHVCRTPAEASRVAMQMGGALVLKIASPDVSHKSDVGGVALNLQTPLEVEKAANAMLERVAATYPQARIDGFTVQRMAIRPGAQELIVGVTSDPMFGPVILFGQGGTAVEVIGDRAVALPPLNMTLAREMIARTRVYKLLQGYRANAPADLDAICLTLMQVAQLIIDIPEIVDLDLNPLLADDQGVVAVDAHIGLAPAIAGGADRLAIRPYPQELEEKAVLADGRPIFLRPIRPEDEPNHHILVSRLTPEDVRLRFFGLVHELPHTEMARLTQIDYDREMAFIATATDPDGKPETLGVVRTVTDPDNEQAEFAIVVRSDVKGSGLGRILLEKMVAYCRSRRTRSIVGQVLRENHRMLTFVEGLGFKRCPGVDNEVVEVKLTL